MGSLARPPLAAAVAEAGALGMVGLSGAPPEYAVRALEEVRRRTSGVFGVNFIVDGVEDPTTHELDADLLASLDAAASRARVVEFFYDTPRAALVERGHAGGALVAWQVGSLEEAIAAERVGCDFIVAQGTEAGGHVRGKTGLMTLLDQVLPAVHVPVVAAGGIGSGRGMAAALAAGASGVRVGTRFVAAAESEAHPRYIEALIRSEAGDTILTEAFSTNWPNAPHRVLRASVDALNRTKAEFVGENATAWAPDKRVPVPRGASMVPLRHTTGDVDAMPHWAGESVGDVTRVQPAAEIVRELAEEAERLLGVWGSGSPRTQEGSALK